MTAFVTQVGGIPCQCGVLSFSSEVPASYENPPEPSEFDFELLDRRGRRAQWLDKFLSPEVEMRLLCEWIEQRAEYYTEPEYD